MPLESLPCQRKVWTFIDSEQKSTYENLERFVKVSYPSGPQNVVDEEGRPTSLLLRMSDQYAHSLVKTETTKRKVPIISSACLPLLGVFWETYQNPWEAFFAFVDFVLLFRLGSKNTRDALENKIPWIIKQIPKEYIRYQDGTAPHSNQRIKGEYDGQKTRESELVLSLCDEDGDEGEDVNGDVDVRRDGQDQDQSWSPRVRRRSDSEKGKKSACASTGHESKSTDHVKQTDSKSPKRTLESQPTSPHIEGGEMAEVLSGILSPRVNIDGKSSPSAHYDFGGECSVTLHQDLCGLCAENMSSIDEWIQSSFTKFFPVQYSQLVLDVIITHGLSIIPHLIVSALLSYQANKLHCKGEKEKSGSATFGEFLQNMGHPRVQRFLDRAISLNVLAKRSMTAPHTVAPFPKL
eukprot:TRINITY_DN1090_c0_g1_i2.p1 TRINITY_DN1090_c0_g1~~TRINITY_DN1090_c0_g1_i2.p1  ORF type:complete len:407 (+),score=70.73 TRINITY_DN1090_c0_g1_i2:296-1516(+)